MKLTEPEGQKSEWRSSWQQAKHAELLLLFFLTYAAPPLITLGKFEQQEPGFLHSRYPTMT